MAAGAQRKATKTKKRQTEKGDVSGDPDNRCRGRDHGTAEGGVSGRRKKGSDTEQDERWGEDGGAGMSPREPYRGSSRW